jgi:hypothetical protein
MLHLKLLQKQEQAKPKTSRSEIIKRRAEINEIEANKQKPYKESMKHKASSLKKINKIDRTLANLTKMRREKTQISKIRNAKGDITTNTTKSRKSSETTLRTHILINLKILKKWTDS